MSQQTITDPELPSTSQIPYDEAFDELTAYAKFLKSIQHMPTVLYTEALKIRTELTRLQNKVNDENIKAGVAMPVNGGSATVHNRV